MDPVVSFLSIYPFSIATTSLLLLFSISPTAQSSSSPLKSANKKKKKVAQSERECVCSLIVVTNIFVTVFFPLLIPTPLEEFLSIALSTPTPTPAAVNSYTQTYKHTLSLPLLICYTTTKMSKMADLEQSHSEDTSVDTREENSQETQDSTRLEFSEDEDTLVTLMFSLVGERWALIAGRIPGRSAEEVEKYWTSRYSSSE